MSQSPLIPTLPTIASPQFGPVATPALGGNVFEGNFLKNTEDPSSESYASDSRLIPSAVIPSLVSQLQLGIPSLAPTPSTQAQLLQNLQAKLVQVRQSLPPADRPIPPA
jgi:hypothetical protein